MMNLIQRLFPKKAAEAPAPEPLWKKYGLDPACIYWDSMSKGIVFPTEDDALDALKYIWANWMDCNKDGHCVPLRFEHGVLLERLRNKNGTFSEPYCNATHLVGEPGNYGIIINIGGAGWYGGVSALGPLEANMLEFFYGHHEKSNG